MSVVLCRRCNRRHERRAACPRPCSACSSPATRTIYTSERETVTDAATGKELAENTVNFFTAYCDGCGPPAALLARRGVPVFPVG